VETDKSVRCIGVQMLSMSTSVSTLNPDNYWSNKGGKNLQAREKTWARQS